MNTTLGRGCLSAVGNRKGSSGGTLAAIVSLIPGRNRAMQVGMGRWQARDPLMYIDGPNVYAYAEARPIAGSDPSGLQDIDWAGGKLNEATVPCPGCTYHSWMAGATGASESKTCKLSIKFEGDPSAGAPGQCLKKTWEGTAFCGIGKDAGSCAIGPPGEGPCEQDYACSGKVDAKISAALDCYPLVVSPGGDLPLTREDMIKLHAIPVPSPPPSGLLTVGLSGKCGDYQSNKVTVWALPPPSPSDPNPMPEFAMAEVKIKCFPCGG